MPIRQIRRLRGWLVAVALALAAGPLASAGMPTAAAAQSQPTLTVAADTSKVTEGTAAEFTVSASAAPSSAITVSYTVTQEGHFVSAANLGSKQVTLAANAASVSVSVPTVGDGINEPDGSVKVTIDAGTGYTVGSSESASVSVSDNDRISMELSVPDWSASEGDSKATARLYLSLTRRTMAAGESISVPLLFEGGRPGTDFSLRLSGTITEGITFDAASSTVTFTGPIAYVHAHVTVTASDDADAVSERVQVTIPRWNRPDITPRIVTQNMGLVSASYVDYRWLLMADDDVAVQPTPAVQQVPADWALAPTGLGSGDRFRLLFLSSAKRNAASADISAYNGFVQARAAAGHASIRPYSAGFRAVASTPLADASANTATASSDTDAAVYWLGGAKIADDYADFWDGSWANETTAQWRTEAGAAPTPGTDDYPWTGTTSGGAKAGTAHLGALTEGLFGRQWAVIGRPGASGGPVDGGETRAVGEQRRVYGLSQVFEIAARPQVSVTAGPSPVTEGTAASFTLTASPSPSDPITVAYTVAQTGSYVTSANRGAKQIQIGTSGTATVTVPTMGDSTDEPDGSVTVTVDDGTGYETGGSASATVRVEDDDQPRATPRLSVSRGASSVKEGSPARFTIHASPTVSGTLSVRYRVGQSGSYLAAGPGAQTVRLTGSSAAISIATQDDSTDEPDGSVTVTLLDGSGYTVASPSSQRITVRDDDSATVIEPGGGSSSPGGVSVGPSGGGGGGAPAAERERSDATVIVADGWSPADVGVAAVLSAATSGSAVLYADTDGLPAPTRELLDDYLPAEVIVVGGPAAVSDATASAIRRAAELDGIERIAGADRTATAAAVARRALDSPSATDGPVTLVVANGWSPSDIGVAAALAARTRRAAVLYAGADGLDADAEAVLRDYQPASVVIIGGPAAVTVSAEQSVRDIVPAAAVERIAGTGRAATAAAAARSALGDPARVDAVTFVIANGWSAPDIGVAAAFAARTPRSAVLYAAPGGLDEPTTALLADHRIADVVIIGGTDAVTAQTQQAIRSTAPDVRVIRIAGVDRTATAAAAARRTLGDP